MAKSAAALHILVKEEKLALEILAKLERGVSFDHLAKRYSQCPSGRNGGDLGWSTPDSYVPEFAQAMTQLAKGAMTDTPVKSQFGWHIIRIEDVRDGQLPPLEEVKAQIKQELEQQKMGKFQDELRAKAKVE